MSATLAMTRRSVALELRRARFEIELDGATVGSIDHLGAFETEIEPGRHTLQVRMGRYTSSVESFNAADGDTVSFRCHGARLWPVYLVSIVVPSLALVLRRE